MARFSTPWTSVRPRLRTGITSAAARRVSPSAEQRGTGSAASGGSLNLRARDIAAGSSGTLAVHGAIDGNIGSSGGGRVAVAVGQGSIPDTLAVQIHGGLDPDWRNSTVMNGASGTYYRETPDRREIVVRNNNDTRVAKTALPARFTPVDNANIIGMDAIADFAEVAVTVARGTLYIEKNVTTGVMTLDASAQLDLGGRTLTVYALFVGGVQVPAGAYSAAQLALPQIVDSSANATGVVIAGAGNDDTPFFITPVAVLPGGDGVIRATAELTGVHGAGVESWLLWGTEPGVWTGTNKVAVTASGNVTNACTEPVVGTYFYSLAVAVNGAIVSEASILIPTFHNGTPAITIPQHAAEPYTNGRFTITREGLNNVPLTLCYALTGTAKFGVDYTVANTNTIVIPAGEASVDIIISPLRNYVKLGDTTVVLTLTPGGYFNEPSAVMTIVNEAIPDFGPDVNVWLGKAAGWSLGHKPLTGETVRLGAYSNDDLAWNVADGYSATVADWIQEPEYTGTVTVHTTYDPLVFPLLTITGDLLIPAGTWTHPANSATAQYRLNVAVGGDFTLGAKAVVNVNERGFWTGNGPGCVGWYGAAHGGRGGNQAGNPNTYGSVFDPVDLGSPSTSDWNHIGGGAARFNVAGTARIDGQMLANGRGYFATGAAASGGSLNLRARDIAPESSGLLYALGGVDGNGGSGGGGRIAVVVRQGGIPATLTVQVHGGFDLREYNETQNSASGTYYHATPNGGEIVIRNNNDTRNAKTALPARLLPGDNAGVIGVDDINDFKTTDLRVERGSVVIERALKLQNVAVENAASVIDLNGQTLRVRTLTVNGARVRSGPYAGETLPSGVIGDGQLIVGGFETILMVR